LNEQGQVMSLQLAPASSTVKPALATVVMKTAIAAPLPTDAGSYITATPVPTPTGQVAPFLSLPRAALVTAGQVGKDVHLYVVDGQNHRILDLQQDSGSSAGGTPTAGATSPASSPTVTGTHTNDGGGVVSNQITMQLKQQYVSSDQFAGVKSIVTNPKSAGFSVLVQSGSAGSDPALLSVDLTQPNTCPST